MFILFLLYRDTASKAGFNVLRIISEPAAALVGYDVGKTDHHVPW